MFLRINIPVITKKAEVRMTESGNYKQYYESSKRF
jgi:hypothetical protein